MKLKYKKPDFAVEHFDLAQSIAAGCSAIHNSTFGKPNQGNITECGWDVGGAVIWTNTDFSKGCNTGSSPNEEILGVCYNNPNGHSIVFAS